MNGKSISSSDARADSSRSRAISLTLKPSRSRVLLNLGCGEYAIDGFVNVDNRPFPWVDVVHDLSRYPWPWTDASVDGIFASHVVEHIPRSSLISFIEESARVLKPGAPMIVIVPHPSHARAVWTHPEHQGPVYAQAFIRTRMEDDTRNLFTIEAEVVSRTQARFLGGPRVGPSRLTIGEHLHARFGWPSVPLEAEYRLRRVE